MSEQMMNEVLKRLDLIGEKLGEGAQFTWEAYMRQAILINGWMTLVGGIAMLLLATGLWILAVWLLGSEKKARIAGEREERDWDGERKGSLEGAGIAAGFGGAVLTVIGGIIIAGAVAHLINPQYYALMELAKLVGK